MTARRLLAGSTRTASETVTIAIPREALTVVERARTVSQKTSERVLGVPAETFLDLVSEYREAGGEVLHAKRLRLVDVEAFLSWLRRREQVVHRDIKPGNDTMAPLDEADALAVELGLRRAAP